MAYFIGYLVSGVSIYTAGWQSKGKRVDLHQSGHRFSGHGIVARSLNCIYFLGDDARLFRDSGTAGIKDDFVSN